MKNIYVFLITFSWHEYELVATMDDTKSASLVGVNHVALIH